MNKNIEIKYENGKPILYVTKATEDLYMPSLGFSTQEEAELAIAVVKTLKAYNMSSYFNIADIIHYVLRVIGIKNEWTE